jgi:hypothetical protein
MGESKRVKLIGSVVAVGDEAIDFRHETFVITSPRGIDHEREVCERLCAWIEERDVRSGAVERATRFGLVLADVAAQFRDVVRRFADVDGPCQDEAQSVLDALACEEELSALIDAVESERKCEDGSATAVVGEQP